MIARLEGIIVHTTEKFLIIDASGVGYKLYVTSETLSMSLLGDHASFWVYTAVRENSSDLYGFKNTNEMAFFKLLLDVSGSVLALPLILAIAPIDKIKKSNCTATRVI